jgi:hypothetical protein
VSPSHCSVLVSSDVDRYSCRRWIRHWNASRGAEDYESDSFLEAFSLTLNALQEGFEAWLEGLDDIYAARDTHKELKSATERIHLSSPSKRMHVGSHLLALEERMKVSHKASLFTHLLISCCNRM